MAGSLNVMPKISRAVIRSSILLGGLGLVSRLFGLIRDRILASRFGASDVLDVYYISFGIPDFVFNLFVFGAIAAVLVPAFIEAKSRSRQEAFDLINSILSILGTAIGLGAIFAGFAAPWIIKLVAPGFDPGQHDLAVLFTRVMLVSPVLLAFSLVFGSILQAEKRFLAFALSPIFYNLGIIIGAIWLVPLFGPLGLPEGVVLGALFHLIVHSIAVRRVGFRWRLLFEWSSNVRKVLVLLAPRSISLVMYQINLIVVNAIATTVSVGVASALALANNLQYLPIALVGVSVAIASFSDLSQEALDHQNGSFGKLLTLSVKQVLVLVLPASGMLLYFRQEIVSLFLGAGRFDASDVRLTAMFVGAFCLGIFGHSLVPILARATYALRNTSVQVIATVAGSVTTLILAFLVVWNFDVALLPFALSLGGLVQMLILLTVLDVRWRVISMFEIINYAIKVGIGVGLTYIVMSLAFGLVGDMLQSLRLIILLSLGFIVFYAYTRIVRINELREILRF